MALNFEALGMQKWNIATDSAQRIDETNGFICLFFMFTTRVAVMEMARVFVFSGDDRKKIITVLVKY